MPTPQPASAPIVASSDLSFQPTPAADPRELAEFDQSVSDIISEIEGEFEPKYDFGDEPDGETEDAEGTSLRDDPDAGGQAPEATPEPEADDPAIARGMERLVQREVALQAREVQIQAREARLQTLEQENATLKARLPALDALEQLGTSPFEAVKAMGHDPNVVIKTMIAEKLQAEGQPVPPELQQFIKETQADRRIKALERQIAERQAAEQATTYFNTVFLGAREYVNTKVGAAKNLPTLANIAKGNPEHAHREIMEEITKDAQARAATDPNGEPLAYEEAALRVEKRLATLKALFGPASTTPEKPAPGAKAATPPQPKPPARPLAPWQSKTEDVYAKGLQEAEREFYKLEAARKARR